MALMGIPCRVFVWGSEDKIRLKRILLFAQNTICSCSKLYLFWNEFLLGKNSQKMMNESR
ncbi:hypothetical protein JCM10512_2035 [Bacteroides reticulotermitis JCM 10512]|uniref:Uncharacterized protein n=1 Tax=Bacteroides reticulotermitis JCM 10512 TaxID=1445607 RepID=W4URZ8_9BACE|nr:hypothetical protein JCM10512_2035 [Bacteroides reticulotermitis JCM 10512]